ncbi:MAG: phage portal protein, partial [Sulfurimonas sp.]|uniref:phage portal protein n=1 Tax=Sulfurimonas sp. TaxID=2022749 RepID=UPI0025D7EB93
QGAEAKQVGRTPKEMDYIKSQEQAMYAICSTFGVDPRLIGAQEFSGRAARQEAERAYWIHTVIPEVQMWTEYMTVYYKQFWPDIRVSYDLANIEALQDEFSGKAAAGRTLFDMGVPLEEINRRLELDLNLDDVPGASEPYGITLSRKSDSRKSDSRIILWRRKDGERRIWEKRFAESFAKGLKKDLDVLADVVQNGESVTNYEDTIRQAWEERLSVSHTVLGKFFGEKKYDELVSKAKNLKPGQRKNFDATARVMADFIRQVSRAKAGYIASTTILRVRNLAAEAVEKGLALSEVAQRIRDQAEVWTEPLERSRAMRIARTEAGAGINHANYAARQQAITEFNWKIDKEWLETPDTRTRDGSTGEADHTSSGVGGERVPNDQPYSNGLMYPGDPSGPAEEVIECRCSETEHVNTEGETV